MAKIYCSNCGELVNDNSNFCKFCGVAQKGQESAAFRVNQPPVNPNNIAEQPTQKVDLVTNFEALNRQYLGTMAIVFFFLQYIRYSGLIVILLMVGAIFEWIYFVPFIVIYFIFLLILSNLKYENYRYSLTDSVLIIDYGIITKKQVSIPYVQIENVNIKRSILDLILGLAQISIETAGGEEVTVKGSSKYFSEGDIPAISLSTAKKLHDILLETAEQFQRNG